MGIVHNILEYFSQTFHRHKKEGCANKQRKSNCMALTYIIFINQRLLVNNIENRCVNFVINRLNVLGIVCGKIAYKDII